MVQVVETVYDIWAPACTSDCASVIGGCVEQVVCVNVSKYCLCKFVSDVCQLGVFSFSRAN